MKKFEGNAGDGVLTPSNETLQLGDNVFLSYLHPDKRSELGEVFDSVINLFTVDSHARLEETAIVRQRDEGRDFFILNGDHRQAYEEIVNAGGGFDECYAYYRKHTSQRSPFSTDAPVVLKEQFRHE